MAEAIGFSAFGAHHNNHPNKKRKYNAQADAAFVDGQPTAEASTGSNSTPLGQRAAPAPLQKIGAANTDEIDLEDEEDGDEDLNEGGQEHSATSTAGATLPGQALPRPAGLPQRPAPGIGFINVGASRGPKYYDNHGAGGVGGGAGGRGHGGGDGGRNWHEGYYDCLSNQNPWERLEKAMGLESKGTWLAQGS
jgi:hypothetical protein